MAKDVQVRDQVQVSRYWTKLTNHNISIPLKPTQNVNLSEQLLARTVRHNDRQKAVSRSRSGHSIPYNKHPFLIYFAFSSNFHSLEGTVFRRHSSQM